MISISTIKEKALESDFLKDSFWALLGNVLSKGMSLLGAVLVARFLGKDVYGEYGTIKSTLMNIAIFSTFGLGYTATKYVAEYRNKDPRVLKTVSDYSMKTSLLVSGTMAVLLFFFSNYVSVHLLKAEHLNIPLKIVAIWIVFNSLTTTQVGILSGFKAFKQMARINGVVGGFAFVSSAVFTYFWGLIGALIALLLTQVLNWFLNYKEVLKLLPKVKALKSKTLLKELLNFSLPVALQEALYSLTSWLLIYLLITMADYGEVGIYSAAMQWSAIILFIPGILRNVVLSHFSAVLNDEKSHNSILKYTLCLNFIFTLLPFLIVYYLKSIVVQFYGKTYGVGLEEVLSVSLLSVIFMSLSNVYSQAYLSRGESWSMFIIRFLRDAGVLVVSGCFLYFQWLNGGIAVVTANLIIQALFLFILAIVYHLKIDRQHA
ncbi:oligosaccharide flippase family protein [Echinicola marina]|uniref:oligosaccharide flippase family protein n=1 Tax=Echinicola marina TaxID=2859768 RepID=UPI001CF6474B|nr:oligosaccharide flippase family protein [Echinicola marina]UCS93983.1 oligosaccharide flippase family protein [Echinicola marina]